jgi:hypothetical protein
MRRSRSSFDTRCTRNKKRARIAFVNEVRGLTMKQRLGDVEKADLQAKLAAFARDLGVGDSGEDVTDDREGAAESDIPF